MSEHDDEFYGRPELMRKRARTIIAWRFFIACICMFMMASMCILVYNAIASIQTRHALLDCTVPTGKCYKQGQKNTAKAVEGLIEANHLGDVATRRVVIVAAACAKVVGVDSVREIEDCVNAQLEEDKK